MRLLMFLLVLQPIAEAHDASEDCLQYDPQKVVVQQSTTGWAVMEHGPTWDHRIATFRQAADAQQLVALIRKYPLRCFIGRFSGSPTPYLVVQYWKSLDGSAGLVPPTGGTDCVAYDSGHLQIGQEEQGQLWRIYDQMGKITLRAHSKPDADRLLQLATDHSKVCFIGRNGRTEFVAADIVQYWQ